MASIKSSDDLKRFLITSQLVRLDDWNRIESQVQCSADVEALLESFEQHQLLTSLQTARILKGETDGLILGGYKLLYRNASGSYARVYRASTLDGRRIVAVKLLRERWSADPEAVADFHREARICKKFKHPNIVPIHEIGSEGRHHYFTMEFVEGGTLLDFLTIRTTLTPAEAGKCIYEICDGLEYALSLGATHRDLKLTNVLMSSSGVAKLVDFGLAGADSASLIGNTDDVNQALEYASLERGTAAPHNDPRTDIFFAGAMLYELLSGQPPWPRTRDREEKKQLSRYSKVPPLQSVVSGIPDEMVELVGRMMEINPQHRIQSAAEVKAALRHVLDGTSGVAIDAESSNSSDDQNKGKSFELLVVDSVQQRCEALEQYFERHPFSLSFVERSESAIERLKGSDPPDGILFMADTDVQPILRSFPKAQAYGRSLKVPCLAIFAEEDEEAVRRAISATRFGATKFQPVKLREIRTHFEDAVASVRK